MRLYHTAIKAEERPRNPTVMKTKSPRSLPILLALLFLAAAAAAAAQIAMAAEPEQAAPAAAQEETAVHIVYVDRPADADPEEFHIRTLAAVLGSEKAKDAVLYHYKHAASGFSAKLTPKQVEELKKQPGVLQVVPSQTYQLHGPGATTTNTVGLMNRLG